MTMLPSDIAERAIEPPKSYPPKPDKKKKRIVVSGTVDPGELTFVKRRTQLSLRLRERLTKSDHKPNDIGVDYAVPELGQKLLPFLLSRKLREAVAGDLEQDFQDFVKKFGRRYAVRWYWWELSWLCISRLKVPAIVVTIAFWLRRQIGF